MPSSLPYIQVRTQPDTIVKMKFIAEQRKQSVSKAVENMILDEIETFEKENGEILIHTMSPNEIVDDVKKRIQKKPPYGDE